MDPDPSGPRSNGLKRGALGRVRTLPGSALYIKGFGPVSCHFHQSVLSLHSSLFVFLSSPFKNPNPSSFGFTQNLFKHAPNDSFLCSKHEFTACNHFQPVNRCRSWLFLHGLRMNLFMFLVLILF